MHKTCGIPHLVNSKHLAAETEIGQNNNRIRIVWENEKRTFSQI